MGLNDAGEPFQHYVIKTIQWWGAYRENPPVQLGKELGEHSSVKDSIEKSD